MVTNFGLDNYDCIDWPIRLFHFISASAVQNEQGLTCVAYMLFKCSYHHVLIAALGVPLMTHA